MSLSLSERQFASEPIITLGTPRVLRPLGVCRLSWGGCIFGGRMTTLRVPYSSTGKPPRSRQEYRRTNRKSVPVIKRFRGLAVTPTTGARAGFSITHVATGCVVPPFIGLSYSDALDVAAVLSVVFPWEKVRDVMFFKGLSPEHRDAMRGCIIALREMFGLAGT